MSIYGRIADTLLRMKYKEFVRNLNAKDKNLKIFGPITIKNAEKIVIGENCRINDHAFLHGGGGIVIEDGVTISAYAKIISYGYDTSNWKENYLVKNHVPGPIHIGKGAWIGAGAMILPGVKISGKGIIIAAGSVITKDIAEDFVLVGGTPARVLKSYNDACKITN